MKKFVLRQLALNMPGWAWGFFFERGHMQWLCAEEGQSACLVGPPGLGKAVRLLILNLILGGGVGRGGLWVHDPKLELYCTCAASLRALGKRAYLIAPFPGELRNWPHETIRTARYNPLLELPPPDDPDCVTQIEGLSEGCVTPDGGHAFFTEGARKWLSGVALFTCTLPEDLRNFGTVFRIISARGEVQRVFAQAMHDSGLTLCQAAAEPYLVKDPTHGALELLETCSVQCAFLGQPAIADVLRGPNDFSYDDLKRGDVAVFSGMSPDESARYGRFQRLMLAAALQRCMKPPRAPVRFVIDEAGTALAGASLSQLKTAIEFGRGAGVAIAPLVFQSVPQARTVLGPDGFAAVMAACTTQAFMRPNDMETAAFISQRAGLRTTVDVRYDFDPNDTARVQRVWQPAGTSVGVPVLRDHGLFGLSEDQIVLFREGIADAIVANTAPFWAIPAIQSRVNVNPYAPDEAVQR